MICPECKQPCDAPIGAADWYCRCTDDCRAHHRNCGLDGYACLWCRVGNPMPIPSYADMIALLDSSA